MSVKVLEAYADCSGKATDVVVKFEFHVAPREGFRGGDIWTGTVHFSSVAEPYELELVDKFGAKYGPLLPETLTTGRFHEAICADEVLYVFMRSPEERRVFEPVLEAAREHYRRMVP